MAVEIREIGIRMRVSDGESPSTPRPADGGGDLSDHDRAAIIDECVRRVTAMLRTRRER